VRAANSNLALIGLGFKVDRTGSVGWES